MLSFLQNFAQIFFLLDSPLTITVVALSHQMVICHIRIAYSRNPVMIPRMMKILCCLLSNLWEKLLFWKTLGLMKVSTHQTGVVSSYICFIHLITLDRSLFLLQRTRGLLCGNMSLFWGTKIKKCKGSLCTEISRESHSASQRQLELQPPVPLWGMLKATKSVSVRGPWPFNVQVSSSFSASVCSVSVCVCVRLPAYVSLCVCTRLCVYVCLRTRERWKKWRERERERKEWNGRGKSSGWFMTAPHQIPIPHVRAERRGLTPVIPVDSQNEGTTHNWLCQDRAATHMDNSVGLLQH